MVVELNCDFCDESFERSPSHVSDKNFCSNKCYKNYREENSNKIDVTCNRCGEKFKITPSRFKNAEKFYCSKRCESNYRRENAQSGEDHRNYDRIDTECSFCGESIEVIPWEYENYDNNFCSNECKYDWKSKNIRGENHSNYKDGSAPSKYPREFYKIRDEIISKYDEKCVVCGMTQKEHRKKYNKGICVHHIDGDVSNNDKSNLTVLCQPCNSKVEHLDHRPDIEELRNRKNI